MTNAIEKITTPPPAPAPGFVGQATAIEQSRAVAEVQAAIVVAQQCPRDITAAVHQMQQSCMQKALAERSFYRYPRGKDARGKPVYVTGPTIHLARELARCWGNVQYGIAELRRDDDQGLSEMQAYAWDVQTNTRTAQIFIVPHRRDKIGGPEKLVDLRDIYENNTNNGARRLRQAIFAILPPWFTEDAKDRCTATLADGGGRPLAQRIADAIARFGERGVAADQLEQKLGRAPAKWTEHDLAQLLVIYKSLDRGEVTADEEFPPQRVTVDEIAGGKPAEVPKQPPADEPWLDVEVAQPPDAT